MSSCLTWVYVHSAIYDSYFGVLVFIEINAQLEGGGVSLA